MGTAMDPTTEKSLKDSLLSNVDKLNPASTSEKDQDEVQVSLCRSMMIEESSHTARSLGYFTEDNSSGFMSPGSESKSGDDLSSGGFTSISSSRGNSSDRLTPGTFRRDDCGTFNRNCYVPDGERFSDEAQHYVPSNSSSNRINAEYKSVNAAMSSTVRFSPADGVEGSSKEFHLYQGRSARSCTPSSLRSSPLECRYLQSDHSVGTDDRDIQVTHYTAEYNNGHYSRIKDDENKSTPGMESTRDGCSSAASVFTYSFGSDSMNSPYEAYNSSNQNSNVYVKNHRRVNVNTAGDGSEDGSSDGGRILDCEIEPKIKKVIHVKYHHVITFTLDDLIRACDAASQQSNKEVEAYIEDKKSFYAGSKKKAFGRKTLKEFWRAMSPAAHRKKNQDSPDSCSTASEEACMRSVDYLNEKSSSSRGRSSKKGASNVQGRGKSVDCLMEESERNNTVSPVVLNDENFMYSTGSMDRNGSTKSWRKLSKKKKSMSSLKE